MKHIFSSFPILLAINLHKICILSTDCSALAKSFCLQQEQHGILHPVSYGSKWLSEAESHLSTIERELLVMAVEILGILKYSRFLMGYHFIVKVHHKPIKWLQTNKLGT